MARAMKSATKRLFDVVAAAVVSVLLLPLVGVVAVAVRCRLGSPVIFRQMRTGRHGQVFELVKFRTMTESRDAHGQLLPDSERLTDLGRLLRKTSLDELPELLNVLRGDMSLVGPRPLPVHYAHRYSPEERRRHEVRPGITGLAQVRGRNALDWNERLAADVWYVDNWTFMLDLKILVRTAGVVLGGAGVSAPDHVTMAELSPYTDRSAAKMGK